MPNDAAKQPNVLCFITDQQRHDHLGCAGNPLIRTPNIDRLAASGVRFERCYVNNPICSPSRATMWTGLSVHAHRMRANGMHLDPTLPTIPGVLSSAGYRTYGVGKMHLTPFSAISGADPATLNPADWPESRQMWFDGRISKVPAPFYGLQNVDLVSGHGDWFWGQYRNWLIHEAPDVARAVDRQKKEGGENWQSTHKSLVPAELHHSRWIADRAIDFLREQSYIGGSFFCWCSFPDPHHPYHAPDPYFSMYDPKQMPEPNRRDGELDDLPPHYRASQNERYRVVGMPTPVSRYYHTTPEIIARTYAMVSNIDANVGRVLDALEELGMRENTVIVYLSDHGDNMGDHWLQQKGPFHFDGLIRVPYIWSWPGHIAQNSAAKSMSSILDFAPTLLDLCGLPVPDRPSTLHPREPAPWPGHSLRAILEGEQTPVRDSAFIDHDDDASGLRLRTLVTDAYRLTWYVGQPYGELFDLRDDPQELHNLWDDEGYRAVRSDMTALLLDEVCLSDQAFPRMLSGS
jgi:arylsulfatase A-like enzyme